jgi:peptide/nickel transport system permease protein
VFGYIARRLLASLALFAVVVAGTFFILHLSTGKVARGILGPDAAQEVVAQKERELGLDRPVVEQFAGWTARALRGDLGRSWFNGEPVAAAISARLPVTLGLVTAATVLIAVISMLLGVLAATRRGWIDRTVQVISVLGFAVPNFILAVLLASVFAIRLGWFKAVGYQSLFASPSGWVDTATLPVIALAVSGIAGVAPQVRGALLDALGKDYVRTLRSRGLPWRRVVYRHVLRGSMGPALSMLGVHFIGMFGGAVLIERIFAIPGIGQMSVNAALNSDVPLVMGFVVAVAVFVVLLNLIVDLLQAWLDPRVRMAT